MIVKLLCFITATGISLAVVPDFREARLKTTWNSHIANYTVDGNPATCGMTGFDDKPMVEIEFNNVRAFSSVRIRGDRKLPNIYIFAANTSQVLSKDKVRTDSCAHDEKAVDISGAGVNIPCILPVWGKILILASENQPATHMSVCEVEVA